MKIRGEKWGSWGHSGCMYHCPANQIRKQRETHGRQSQGSSKRFMFIMSRNSIDRFIPFNPSNFYFIFHLTLLDNLESERKLHWHLGKA